MPSEELAALSECNEPLHQVRKEEEGVTMRGWMECTMRGGMVCRVRRQSRRASEGSEEREGYMLFSSESLTESESERKRKRMGEERERETR